MSFALCKGELNERADMISRPDGSLTCDIDEMDAFVCNAWLPIFRMYAYMPAPSWKRFKRSSGKHLGARHDMHIDSLSGEQLRRTLSRMRSKSAAGCDGWRVDVLKRLRLPLLDRLACLFNAVED